MKVKIKKAPDNHWYSGMIGEEFSVLHINEDEGFDALFKVKEGWIYADDCDVIYEIWDSVSYDKHCIPLAPSDPKLVWWLNTSTPEYMWMAVEKSMMKDGDTPSIVDYESMAASYPRTPEESFMPDKHYNNDNGSLYLFAENHNLNAWEFEIIKRIVRCRKKGEWITDLKKTIRVIELYLKEQGSLYENQIEKPNN